jgi:Tol biopolymer transport system component
MGTGVLTCRAMAPRTHGWGSGRIGWRSLSGAGILALALASCTGPQVNEPPSDGVVWTRLTPDGIGDCLWPDLGGDSLVYSTSALVQVGPTQFQRFGRTAVSGIDGMNPVVLSFPGAAPWSSLRPRWAGRQTIVFMDNRQGNYDIWYKDLDTFAETRLLADATNETCPVPRPASPALVYIELLATATSAYDFGRMVLIPDTAAVPIDKIYLTPDSLVCGDPDWDPTGTKLCFSVEDTATHSRHLYTMSLAPGDSLPVQITVGPFTDVHPRWSPDGGRIAFVSNRTGRSGVWIVDPEGEAKGLQLISFDDSGATTLSPTWTPDGLGLILSSDGRTGVRSLWRLSNLPPFDF